jgi:hypothetical protein
MAEPILNASRVVAGVHFIRCLHEAMASPSSVTSFVLQFHATDSHFVWDLGVTRNAVIGRIYR